MLAATDISKPELTPKPRVPSYLPKPVHDISKMPSATEMDLQSDDKMWAIYHDWCRYHKIHRTHEEMKQRFEFFKLKAKRVVELNRYAQETNSSGRYALTSPADRTPEEVAQWLGPIVPDDYESSEYSEDSDDSDDEA